MKFRPRGLLCLACYILAGPMILAEEPQTEGWLRDLGNDAFKSREAAESALHTWAGQQPDKAQQLFLKQVQQSPDPEVRMRCRSLLKDIVLMDFRKQGEGFVGIQMFIQRLDGATPKFGIRVTVVTPDTPATRAGIQAGDVVLELEGEGWTDEAAMQRFTDVIRKHHPGERVKMKIRRGAQEIDIEVELARRPEILNNNNGMMFFGDGEFDPSRLQAQAEEKYFKEWLSQRKVGASPDPQPEPPHPEKNSPR